MPAANEPTHVPTDLLADAESPQPAEPALAGNEGKPRLSRWHHFALSAFWFGNNLHWGALSMVIMQSQSMRMAPQIGVLDVQITGWTTGAGAIVGALVPPLVGAFSDRCTLPLGRRRPYVIGGTILNLIALFLFYLAFRANSLPGYIAAWMLIGLGNNIAVGAFSGIIPDVVPQSDRGLASSWMATMQQFGTIGGFVLGGILMSKGKEQDLLALTVMALALGVVTVLTVVGTPERRLEKAEPFRLSELKECFWVDPRQHPDFGWVWITRAFFTMGWFLIQPILPFFLRDVVQAPDPSGAVALLGGIVLLGAIPTGIAGGVLSDRFGRKRIIYLAAMVMAATCLLFATVGQFPVAQRLMVVYVIAIFWGMGYGAYLSVDWALGTDVLPSKDEAGKDMGVWHLSMVIPQSLAAPLATEVLARFPVPGLAGYRTEGYGLIFAGACVFMFLCGALIFQVKKAR